MGSDDWKIQNELFPEEMQADYVFLHNQVWHLGYHWQVFNDLYSHSEKRIELLNQTAPKFFKLVEEMLIDRLILCLARLLDPKETRGKANATFAYFASRFPDDQLKTELITREKTIKTKFDASHLATWRNKAISHSDYSTAQKFTPLPSIQFADLRECIELAQGWIDCVRVAYDPEFNTEWNLTIEIGGVRELVASLRQSAALMEWERSDWRNRNQVPPGSFGDA